MTVALPRVTKNSKRGHGGIEPPTSPTLKENHTTRPMPRISEPRNLAQNKGLKRSGQTFCLGKTKGTRAQPESNRRPQDLQSHALPLSYAPCGQKCQWRSSYNHPVPTISRSPLAPVHILYLDACSAIKIFESNLGTIHLTFGCDA